MTPQKALFASTTLFLSLLSPSEGQAYIDPGTGGLLFQVGFTVFSVFMGLLFVPVRSFKALIAKIKGVFSRSRIQGAKSSDA